MNHKTTPQQNEIYQIKIKGLLDDKWSDWFDGFSITHLDDRETLLIGPVSDQGALHGILAKIRDLGLHLISVESLLEREAS
jgi:hypothetical protein